MFIPVDDPGDERIALFRLNERGLANRPQRRSDAGAGWFLAEGDLVVERALGAGCQPVAALVDAERPPPVAAVLAAAVPVFAGGERLRAMVTGLGVPHPIIAVFHRPPRPSVAGLLGGTRRIVMVEAVDNPVNVGGIVRNAAGLGWDGLILDGTSADPLARRALRVSMGHAVAFPHARLPSLAPAIGELRAAGFVVVALTPATDAVDLDLIPRADRLAVVIGAERAGLDPTIQAAATVRARIPMSAGVDSLNAAAASAIACYALR